MLIIYKSAQKRAQLCNDTRFGVIVMPVLCAYSIRLSPTCRDDSVLFVNVCRLHPLSSSSRALYRSRLSLPLSQSPSSSIPTHRFPAVTTRLVHTICSRVCRIVGATCMYVLNIRLWARFSSYACCVRRRARARGAKERKSDISPSSFFLTRRRSRFRRYRRPAVQKFVLPRDLASRANFNFRRVTFLEADARSKRSNESASGNDRSNERCSR